MTTTFNLADLFEQAVDEWPDRMCVADDHQRRTFAELDGRANRLAHYLAEQGIGPGDHVGIYALNRVEWVETLWAVFKLRAVWININYRYVEDELAHVFRDAALKFLVVEPEFFERSQSVAPALPKLVIGPEFEAALAAHSPERDFAQRSDDDLYVLFTGGTTGLPKGVVWRHEDVVMALGSGIDVRTGEKVANPQGFLERGRKGFQMICLPIAPLMHGATQWALMGQSIIGNSNVLRARFNPHDIWRSVQDEKANLVMITGDAMARPLLDALDEPGAHYDLSPFFVLSSSAVLFSQTNKDRFLDQFPNLIISDAIGSSESGANGITIVSRGAVMKGGPTVTASRDAVVLDDDLVPIVAGSGTVGRLARSGNIPIGYLNDPIKTAATFVIGADGVRYVMPGDYAQVEADGSITMLGRGSVSINTGGEKVFPEEVENALKAHPGVADAVVVGVPDERWGERIAAVVQATATGDVTLENVQAHCRTLIAGYKVPRKLVLVTEVVRSPAGKTDYRWAKSVASEPSNDGDVKGQPDGPSAG